MNERPMLDETTAQSLNRQLFKRAMCLTCRNHEQARELVQEVWEKVLTHENLDVEQLKTGYFIKMLKNHFFDKQAKRSPVAVQALSPLNDDKATDEGENEHESDRLVPLLNYLKQLKNGWIYQEMIDRDCSLKMLSQLKGIKYQTLCQQKRRLDMLLRDKFGNHFKKSR